MSDWDEDDFLESVGEDDDLTEEEIEEYEELLEEILEIGDEADFYDGPTCLVTIIAGGDEYEVRIPVEFIPDLIDLASEMDIDLEIDSE
jgi:hypothetical protein